MKRSTLIGFRSTLIAKVIKLDRYETTGVNQLLSDQRWSKNDQGWSVRNNLILAIIEGSTLIEKWSTLITKWSRLIEGSFRWVKRKCLVAIRYFVMDTSSSLKWPISRICKVHLSYFYRPSTKVNLNKITFIFETTFLPIMRYTVQIYRQIYFFFFFFL